MKKNEVVNVPNLLSFLRLLLIIPVWVFIDNFPEQNYRYYVAATGVFAAITDILDGYFARKFNTVTEAGKIIDPLADKVLIGFVVLRLFFWGEIPVYYFIMIVGRDFLILLGGAIIAATTKFVLPSDRIGKAAVLAISFVLLMILLNVNREAVYFVLLYYLSIGLIIISFANYVFKAVTIILKK